jgi:hypothetical protein
MAGGVFQVNASLLSAAGAEVAAASRPAQLVYRSGGVRLARTAARLPLLALGWAREQQALEVTLFEGA